MKHTATQTTKFLKLKRRLRLPHFQVVGVLESLWIFTQMNAPRGDIGRHSNEDIAASIEWPDDADELIKNLTECGWLDQCEAHRLIVHDWQDHAPNYLKGNIAKLGGFVCPLGQSQGPPLGPSQGPPLGGSIRTVPPNLTQPNLTKPNQTKPEEYPSGSVPPPPVVASAKIEPKPKADAPIPDTVHHQSIAAFCDAWQTRYGEKYPFNGGKDGETIKRILKNTGEDLEKFRLVVSRYFGTDDEFVLKSRHSLGLFQSQLARWLVDPVRVAKPPPPPAETDVEKLKRLARGMNLRPTGE